MKYLVIILLALPIHGCIFDHSSDGQIVVRSGWAFGLCAVTYCRAEVTITKTRATFIAIDTRDPKVPPIEVSDILHPGEWQSISDYLDTMPTTDTVIGTPDGVDEGEEWIEVTQLEKTVRVRVSCGEDIPGVEDLQQNVRAVRNRLASLVGFGGICMVSRFAST